MRILFIQLPLAHHSRGYINANVEYAPAAISGFIKANFPGHYCETLPNVISAHCSDEVIADYIVNSAFDIVCFTSYLWNIERNLPIASIIKNKQKDLKIFFGGPEISEGSIVFQGDYPFVDTFVSGEGEWFFQEFFSGRADYSRKFNSSELYVQPSGMLIEPESIVEPFSSRLLNTMPDGSVFMEMTRGCPYRCSYCFYSKNFSRVRDIPFEKLINVLKNPGDINEIYLLCPAFDRSSGFREKLTELKNLNHGVNLHTEIRTDRIDFKTAQLMYEAGFRSLEVGLQSLNRRSLESVSRNSDTEMELQGMEYLRDAGIDLKIGIIPGLPGDTPESFVHTVDTLVKRGFADSVELYPLMILPGTAIRDRAVKDGISFQSGPPYFYHEGWGFSFTDIQEMTVYVENSTGLSQSIDYIPDFTESENPLFIKGVKLDENDLALMGHDKIISSIHTLVADIHISCADTAVFYNGFEKFVSSSVISRLYNIIVYSDEPLKDSLIFDILSSHERDNFYRRLHIFNSFSDGSHFQIFQVFSKLRPFLDMQERSSIIRPVFSVTDTNAGDLSRIDLASARLLINRGIYSLIKDTLVDNFGDNSAALSFAVESEMESFFNDAGILYSAYPYSFGITEL
jgi:hypothetical protein